MCNTPNPVPMCVCSQVLFTQLHVARQGSKEVLIKINEGGLTLLKCVMKCTK